MNGLLLGVALLILNCCLILISSSPLSRRSSEHDKVDLEKQCGRKLAAKLIDYADFHRKVLSGSEPARYFVNVPVEAGLADRLNGVIAHFWIAFFSRRAFQMSHYSKLPNFEYAYDYRFINWTRHIHDSPALTAPLFLTYKGVRDYQGDRSYDSQVVDTKLYSMEYLINKLDRAIQIFAHTNLTAYPSASTSYPTPHTVFSSSNRIELHQLFTNPYMQETMREIGATSSEISTFGLYRCAFHFLFQENKHVMKIVHPQLRQLLFTTSSTPQSTSSHAHPHQHRQGCRTHTHRVFPLAQSPKPIPFILGIGLRLGDNVFQTKEPSEDLLTKYIQPYVEVAKALEQQFHRENNCSDASSAAASARFPWYIMADSLAARQYWKRHFGDLVVVDNRTVYYHGDCAYQTIGGCSPAALTHAIVYAAAQLFLFRQCTFKLATFGSGFPFIADELTDRDKLLLSVYYRSDDNRCWYAKRHDADIMWRMDLYKQHDTSPNGVLRRCETFDMNLN